MSSVQLASRYGPFVTRKCPDGVVERAERRPARPRLVGRDPAGERGRHVPPRRPARRGAREGAAPSARSRTRSSHGTPRAWALSREKAARPRATASSERARSVPGHRGPGRRDQGRLGRARRRPVDEHLHDRDLVGELVLAEREHVGLDPQDPQRHQALAQPAPWRARPPDPGCARRVRARRGDPPPRASCRRGSARRAPGRRPARRPAGRARPSAGRRCPGPG